MARKPPTRTCIACGTAADKRMLLRIVRSPEGDVGFDVTGRKPGRGAYLCFKEECFEKAAQRHQIDARLRTKLAPEELSALRVEFRELCAQARQGQ